MASIVVGYRKYGFLGVGRAGVASSIGTLLSRSVIQKINSSAGSLLQRSASETEKFVRSFTSNPDIPVFINKAVVLTGTVLAGCLGTYAAYRAYTSASSLHAKSFVYGVYFSFIIDFAVPPADGRVSKFSLYAPFLRNDDEASVFFTTHLPEKCEAIKEEIATNTLTSYFFGVSEAVSTIALSILGYNPIIANAISGTVHVAAHLVYKRLILDPHFSREPEPLLP